MRTLPPSTQGGASALPPSTQRDASVLPPSTQRDASVLPPSTQRDASVLPQNTQRLALTYHATVANHLLSRDPEKTRDFFLFHNRFFRFIPID
ncbi:ORF5 [Barthadenovirus mellis]|uniref:ORF5 n=1 Tax=Passerine adenovirus 1 TaxID=2779174 RepID=A0A7L9DIT3_9ADEN|nr:ORF5 [Passerine adenovirus 1]